MLIELVAKGGYFGVNLATDDLDATFADARSARRRHRPGADRAGLRPDAGVARMPGAAIAAAPGRGSWAVTSPLDSSAGSMSTPARSAISTSTPTPPTGGLLVVASDRVSAFDHVLEPGIPGKGALLTRLSLWWFDQLDARNDAGACDPQPPGRPAPSFRRLSPTDAMVMQKARHAARRVRGARLPEPAAAGPSTTRARHACAASAARRTERTATACPSRSTRPPQGTARRSTTRTSPTSRPSSCRLRGARRAAARDLCSRVYARAARAFAGRTGSSSPTTKFEFGVDPVPAVPDARRRGAHERQQSILGCRGLRFGRAHRELRQADRAQLARRALGQEGHAPALPTEIVERTADAAGSRLTGAEALTGLMRHRVE